MQDMIHVLDAFRCKIKPETLLCIVIFKFKIKEFYLFRDAFLKDVLNYLTDYLIEDTHYTLYENMIHIIFLEIKN